MANLGAMIISGVCIVVMMAYGFVDVLGRYFFSNPLYGTYELSELLLAIAVFLSLSSCQAEDRHMRVDFILPYLGSRMRATVDALAYVCGISVCLVMAYYSVPQALYSWSISEHTEGIISFPVYPAKICVPIGFSLLALQLAVDLLQTIGPGRKDADANL